MVVDKKVMLYQLDRRVEEGLIRRSAHATLPLLIYSYTSECQFSGAWDKYTMMSRGLIVTTAGDIVATPFHKFFNYGERSCPELPDASVPYEVFEKIDGSLGIYFNYEDKWHVATRGSFDNQFIDYGSRYLSYMDGYQKHHTICTEICMPRDLDGLERAVPHKPGLYFLGGVDIYSGKDLDWGWMAKEWPGYLPRVFTGGVDTLSELARTQVDTEGWVVRWQNGFRIKIKTAWYFRLFRAICRLEEAVRDGMIKGEPKREILKNVPEELKGEAEKVFNQIRKYALEREHYLLGETVANWHDDKKSFALAVAQHPDKHFLFRLYEDKDITPALMEEAPVSRV